jgi:hypothetical protein
MERGIPLVGRPLLDWIHLTIGKGSQARTGHLLQQLPASSFQLHESRDSTVSCGNPTASGFEGSAATEIGGRRLSAPALLAFLDLATNHSWCPVLQSREAG